MAWAPLYVTTPELRKFVTIPADDTESDVELGIAAEAASRAVDRTTHRQFGNVAAPQLRRYTAVWNRRRCRWVVKVDDLMDLVGLEVEITDVGAVTEYRLEPVNHAAEGRPFERLAVDPASAVQPTGEEYEVEITAAWGWSAVPDAVRQATLIQGSRFFTRKDAPFGVAGSPDTGSEMRLLARVDPDVAVSLRGFIRDRVAVG